MPKNARTRTTPDVNAGIEREPAPVVPVSVPPARTERKQIKFTALIDEDTYEMLNDLALRAQEAGRHPVTGRYASRADVVRGLVVKATTDKALADSLVEWIATNHRTAG